MKFEYKQDLDRHEPGCGSDLNKYLDNDNSRGNGGKNPEHDTQRR